MARPKDPAKQKALLDAALALVLKEGMAGVKMSDLARSAGVAIGTAYVYFDDKATLLNALYSHVRARSVQRYAHLHDPARPFMDNFRAIWHAYLQQVLEHPHAAYKALLKKLDKKNPDPVTLSREYQQIASHDYFHSALGQQAREKLLALRGATK